MKLIMYRRYDQEILCGSKEGVYVRFINSSGCGGITFLYDPPVNLDHANRRELNDLFQNVVRREQVEFIKRRYKEEITKFI
ncbi:hypothetical protein [Shimazuella kribbensis]|uniref:hypothetical protein n=1 Tax=Shimazuella kribbensis TaxID=139808 RepID=UPI0004267C5C|nr:hypothetical protein [Shimazuella kribbensis]